MEKKSPLQEKFINFTEKFEFWVIALLMILLMGLIIISIGEFVWLMINGVIERVSEIHDVIEFEEVIHRAFGGLLVVLLGLELMETLKMYFKDHRIRVEIILFVGLIAVGRHIISMNYHEADYKTVLAQAGLVLALSAGYWLVKKTRTPEGLESK